MIYKEIQLDLFSDQRPQTIAESITEYGAGALGTSELIAAIVKPYSTRKGIDVLVPDIIEVLEKKCEPTISDLTSIKGVSADMAAGILVALELGRRRGTNRERTISSPGDIYREVYHFSLDPQEHMVVLVLNGAHEIKSIRSITTGLVNRTLVHPREVFADAIRERATAIAIAHNHPSNNLQPSDEDINVTRRIKASGEILGIKLLDHLIFTRSGYFSMLEHGMV